MNFGLTIILNLLIVVCIADKLHEISDFWDFSGFRGATSAALACGQAKTTIRQRHAAFVSAVFYFAKSK